MFLKYIFTIKTLKHITLFKICCYSYMFRSFWTILRECYVPSIEVASIHVIKICDRGCVFHTLTTVKAKALPLQAWGAPQGSRKLRFLDFMTTAQDGGKVVSLTHRLPLPPGNAPGTHFC